MDTPRQTSTAETPRPPPPSDQPAPPPQRHPPCHEIVTNLRFLIGTTIALFDVALVQTFTRLFKQGAAERMDDQKKPSKWPNSYISITRRTVGSISTFWEKELNSSKIESMRLLEGNAERNSPRIEKNPLFPSFSSKKIFFSHFFPLDFYDFT